ncbi:MAG: phosphodiester glycosidase family protein [Candidatus Poribacteria bacterium]|nr:phosphodiester glycosidase family protein [Candidatus Poribacteria bacterium]
MKGNDQRTYLMRIFTVWGLIIFLILVIGALRTTVPGPGLMTAVSSAIPQMSRKQVGDSPNPSSKRRDYLQKANWFKGMRLYRDWWSKRQAAVYIAEMDRTAKNLRFGVELANSQIVGRETIRSMAARLKEQGILMLAGVNGSFGIREDGMGRGGMIFNLHIQDWELVSIPSRRDRWGYSPLSPWGETSFGVTTDGEFLMDAVQLNGAIHIDGEILEFGCINQLREPACPVVIYTPRFGEQTLTRGGYEVVLTQLKFPVTGKYRSRFVIDAVNMRGNSTIPRRGVVLSLDRRLAQRWRSILRDGATGKLEIALSPDKWQHVPHGIGGNIRLLRNGEIEPELVEFHQSGGGSAPYHHNGIRLHPRSALGFNDDKFFLATVDGRQMGYSIGMTFYEMAEFLRDLGVKHAINFDGGSSSTLWGLGDVVNRPAHGYERRVFNVAMITTQRDRNVKIGKIREKKD